MKTIYAYTQARGWQIKPGLVEQLYLSLKSRAFVILTGHYGTDLSLLPRLFAEAVGATEANGRYLQLTARPDWMDSSDLFGCLDLEGRFRPGAIIDYLKTAQADPENPYFLCLDQVNLSRAEYYLQELLGAVESRGTDYPKPFVTMHYYGHDSAAAARYGQIPALENLYILATVDLDTASRPLNQKLLDRVHTVPVGQADVTGKDRPCVPAAPWDNARLQTRWYQLSDCGDIVPQADFALFEELNRILMGAKAYVGFQLRNDGLLYLAHNRLTGTLPEAAARDMVVCTKILTRVQGSEKSIGETLCKLKEYCEGRYPMAADKIASMQRLCSRDGYASVWDV